MIFSSYTLLKLIFMHCLSLFVSFYKITRENNGEKPK